MSEKDFEVNKKAELNSRGTYNNIFGIGSIDNLILTYRPPKNFDTGDKKGEMTTF
jgi:hypothetical protein